MIAIIDYGVGNLFSLGSSLAALGARAVVTGDPSVIRAADKLILPGVGAFADAAALLRRDGLDQVVRDEARRGKSLLGICLGMQLLLEESLEYGRHSGLNLIPGTAVPIREVSSYYTAAVWSGYDQPERMSSSLQQQSANTWRKVMSAIHEGLEDKSFPTPSAGTVTVDVCADSGLLPTDACRKDARVGESGRIISMTFVKGDEPTTFCEVHKEVEICLEDPFLDADGNPTGMYHLAGEFCPEESRRTVSILDVTRTEAAAAVTVRDNEFTTGHLTALGEAANCTIHTTAQPTEPTQQPEIDPFDHTTWPGPEDFDDPADYDRFNPFDESTYPENVNDSAQEETPPETSQTPEASPGPEETQPGEESPPPESEEPFIPAA